MRRLRDQEAEKIAQGSIVHQTFTQPTEKAGDLTERRIVRWPDGRYFLVELRIPTGEWQSPEAKWATDSPAQFTDEELRLIAASQAAPARSHRSRRD